MNIKNIDESLHSVAGDSAEEEPYELEMMPDLEDEEMGIDKDECEFPEPTTTVFAVGIGAAASDAPTIDIIL